MTYRGDLILESLGRPEGLPRLNVTAMRRVPALHGPAVPHIGTWTILTVEVDEEDAARELAVAFSHCADPGHLGWYFDLLGERTHLFAFLGRLFIVHADAGAGRYDEVLEFCSHRGIPPEQLDFPRLGAAAAET